jgi:hypothetical protein
LNHLVSNHSQPALTSGISDSHALFNELFTASSVLAFTNQLVSNFFARFHTFSLDGTSFHKAHNHTFIAPHSVASHRSVVSQLIALNNIVSAAH